MAFWDIDLTTRAGMRTAASQGGFACFAVAGLSAISIIFIAVGSGLDLTAAGGLVLMLAVQTMIYVIAALHLRAGQGAIWGIFAAILLGLGLLSVIRTLFNGAGLFSLGSIVVNTVLLIILIQGIRGAFALRNNVEFDAEDTDVFD